MSDVPETMRAVLLTGHGGPDMLIEDIARARADFVPRDFIGKRVITTEKTK